MNPPPAVTFWSDYVTSTNGFYQSSGPYAFDGIVWAEGATRNYGQGNDGALPEGGSSASDVTFAPPAWLRLSTIYAWKHGNPTLQVKYAGETVPASYSLPESNKEYLISLDSSKAIEHIKWSQDFSNNYLSIDGFRDANGNLLVNS